MPMLPKHTPRVHLESAHNWPDWTDQGTWELGPPTEADESWWSEQNESWDADDDRPDSDWHRLAEEAEALDRLERGYCC